jgi:hypothetical protein
MHKKGKINFRMDSNFINGLLLTADPHRLTDLYLTADARRCSQMNCRYKLATRSKELRRGGACQSEDESAEKNR